MKTSSMQSKRRDLYHKWPHRETYDYTLLVNCNFTIDKAALSALSWVDFFSYEPSAIQVERCFFIHEINTTITITTQVLPPKILIKMNFCKLFEDSSLICDVLSRLLCRDLSGWKPRRTIVLCSWGVEEHGMLGSTEWAEVSKRHETRHIVSAFLKSLNAYTVTVKGEV